MKLFKRVYYIALAAVFILMFSLTVADVTGGKGGGGFDVDEAVTYLNELAGDQYSHSLLDKTARGAVVTKLTTHLKGFGLSYSEGTGADGKKLDKSTPDKDINFKKSGESNSPTFFVQEMNYTLDDYYKTLGAKASTEKDDDGYILDVTTIAFPLELSNVYAAFPGKAANPKTVVIMAHYDSVPMGAGASDDMSSVAAMLAVIHGMIDSKASYDNNILFVFTDGEEFGMYGAEMAKGFTGFGGAMQAAGFIANFESRGTAGTSIMFETNTNNYEVIKQYAKISNSIYTNSIANFVYSIMPNNTDFSVFNSDVPGVNFANMGQGENYHTQNDNIANATDGGGRAFISQHGDMMGRIAEHFGNLDLSTLTAEGNAVFFTYLNIMVIYYPVIVAFILAGLILALIIAVISANIKKKAFSFKKMGLGVATQLIAIALTVGLMFGVYYIYGLLAALVGKIDIHYISKITFSSPGLMIGMLAFAAIFSAAVYTIFKRIFKIKAGDIVNGSVLVLCILAAALSFVLPEASFLLAWVAFLEAVVWLLTTLLKDKFKAKTGMSIERLFLPLIPVILAMPLTLSVIMLAGDALGAYMYPFIAAVPVLTLGMIAPYFSYLKPAMEKVFAKLPPMRIKQRADAEDAAEKKQAKALAKYKGKGKAAKKSKPAEKGEKKYVYVESKWKYSNAAGLWLVGLVAFIFTLCFSVFGGNQAMAMNGNYGANSGSFKDDALIYVIDKQVGSNYWLVSDLDAYKYMRYELEDYKYDKDKEGYVKTDSNNFFSNITPQITRQSNPNSYYIRPGTGVANIGSTVITRYTLTADNTARSVKSVTLTYYSGGSNSITIDVSKTDKIVLKLTGDVTVAFNTVTGSNFTGTFTYEEELAGLYNRAFENARENELNYGTDNEKNEWTAIKDIGVNKNDASKTLRFKLAVKYIRNYSCANGAWA